MLHSDVNSRLRVGSFVQEGDLHARLSLGCQDACHIVDTDTVKVAVVCDGCSTNDGQKTQNQVGAILGAQHIACGLAGALRGGGVSTDNEFDRILHDTTKKTVRFFQTVRNGMRIEPLEEYEFILQKLIFCVLGFAVVGDRYWVFGLGDGCYGDGDRIIILEKQPTTYLGYSVLRPQFRSYVKANPRPRLAVLASGSITQARHVWVGTDGLVKVLSRENGQTSFQKFVADEFACARSAKGNDTTIMAFRRVFSDGYGNCFADDIALALAKASDKSEKRNDQ